VTNRLIKCKGILPQDLFFCVACRRIQSHSWIFSMATLYIFLSVNLNHRTEFFQQLFRVAESCMAACFTQVLSMAIFEHLHFSR